MKTLNAQGMRQKTVFENRILKLKKIAIGMITGIISRSAVAPFERVIILKQTNTDVFSQKINQTST